MIGYCITQDGKTKNWIYLIVIKQLVEWTLLIVGCCRKICLAIDNVLYAINETTVMWKKELKSLVRENSITFNARLAVLTLDDCLYLLDIENDSIIWSLS